MLRTELQFSITFHLQTDGRTEVVNRSVGDFLRCLTLEHPRRWDIVIAQAEFAFNNVVNHSDRVGTISHDAH